MSTDLSATFAIDSWEEEPFDEIKGTAKLTRAWVAKTYSGDIDGTSKTQWLMAYSEDGSATFVGLERVVGSFGDRTGSLVLQHVGTFADGAATASLSVVRGGGSDEMATVEGDGDFRADPAGSLTLRLTS